MNLERFESLFDAWAESRLTPAEAAELSALLRADPAARKRFREAAAFQAELHATLEDLQVAQAVTPRPPVAIPFGPPGWGIAAALLAMGLTSASLGWALSAQTDRPQLRPLAIHDGGFEALRGAVPPGFPVRAFAWSGDPSDIAAVGDHGAALRFLEAAGEPNIADSPRQSCDVFQIIDLASVRNELLMSSEAYAELEVSLLDARAHPAETVRFIAKIYVLEGQPSSIIGHWPPSADQTIGSGARFLTSAGSKDPAWRSLKTRCVLPPNAGFLVIQLGAGSGGQPGQPSPRLGQQYADDVRLTLHTRQTKAELAAR
jgi:hypothetical protein